MPCQEQSEEPPLVMDLHHARVTSGVSERPSSALSPLSAASILSSVEGVGSLLWSEVRSP